MSFDQETYIDKIESRLRTALSPIHLEVKDESHLHAGHAEAPMGGNSHFRVLIVSDQFEGKTRVTRQRLVNQALAEEWRNQIHALAIKTLTPSEFEALP